jgi:hypothetical protein
VVEMFRSLHRDPLTRRGFLIGGWGFHSKDMRPLQAADVLAYELFKQTENQVVDRGMSRPTRASLRSLMREEDCIHPEYWDKRKLLDWLEIWKEGNVKIEDVSTSAFLSPALDSHLSYALERRLTYQLFVLDALALNHRNGGQEALLIVAFASVEAE